MRIRSRFSLDSDSRPRSRLSSQPPQRRRSHMKPVKPEDRRVINIKSGEYKPFVYEDGAMLGDSVLQLNDELPLGVGFHVYRMPAGMTTRPHRHNGREQ